MNIVISIGLTLTVFLVGLQMVLHYENKEDLT
jgi:hypothetical protein